MLKPHMVVLLNQNILHGERLSPRPPHDGFRYFYSLFIGQRDGQREGSPWSHGQIARKSPARTRQIPDRAMALEWSSVVRDSAVHGEALVETDREGHGSLAGRRIVGGMFGKAQWAVPVIVPAPLVLRSLALPAPTRHSNSSHPLMRLPKTSVRWLVVIMIMPFSLPTCVMRS